MSSPLLHLKSIITYIIRNILFFNEAIKRLIETPINNYLFQIMSLLFNYLVKYFYEIQELFVHEVYEARESRFKPIPSFDMKPRAVPADDAARTLHPYYIT